jgi:1-acyl-sn-glycerol-3-phosphate acyltransferase
MSSAAGAAAHEAGTERADAEARPVGHRPRGLLARALRPFYAVYSLTLLFTLILLASIMALLLPTLAWRRRSTRFLARSWLWLVGLRLDIEGLERLPQGSCVLVANHSSYLDGIVMKAGLPPRFSFVIKREASTTPVLGLLLRRIGSEFVDRHSHGGRQRDGRRVMQRAAQGHSLVFFPEGTFDSLVGLKRFQIGAFVAAARNAVPLVPAVIHGARQSLPNRALVPLPGRLVLEILPALPSAGRPPPELRDEARAMILARLGEPDLVSPAATPGRAS